MSCWEPRAQRNHLALETLGRGWCGKSPMVRKPGVSLHAERWRACQARLHGRRLSRPALEFVRPGRRERQRPEDPALAGLKERARGSQWDFTSACAAFYQEGGKCRQSNDLVMLMIDRWLRRHPARRRVPDGRGLRSFAGFRRQGEIAATLTVPGASRRSWAGLPQDLWRGLTKHVTEASLFSVQPSMARRGGGNAERAGWPTA